MKARVIEVCLAGMKFSDLHDTILELYKDTEIHWAFAEETLCELPRPRTVSEVANELARLSPRHASHNLHNMRDFANNRQHREVTKKTIGYKIKFYVPSSFVPYDENNTDRIWRLCYRKRKPRRLHTG